MNGTASTHSFEQTRERVFCLALVGLAFLPISAIAVSAYGLIPLHVSAPAIVLPGWLFLTLAGVRFGGLGRWMLKGWVAGLIAVSLYDLSRVPFILNGWGDFIPRIGDWLLGREHVHWIVGYGWRYVGNGGGLGVAFAVLAFVTRPKTDLRWLGLAFGVFVFGCLMFTLITSAHGQDLMFRITPLSFAGSLTGHVVYGWVLGVVCARLLPLEGADATEPPDSVEGWLR